MGGQKGKPTLPPPPPLHPRLSKHQPAVSLTLSLSLLYASSIVSVSHTLILLLYYRILINSLSVVVVVANRWKMMMMIVVVEESSSEKRLSSFSQLKSALLGRWSPFFFCFVLLLCVEKTKLKGQFCSLNARQPTDH